MKKSVFIITVICLIWECTAPPEEVESGIIQEETELLSRAWISPPRGGTVLDSFKQAFEGFKAVYEFSCGTIDYCINIGEPLYAPVIMTFGKESLSISFMIERSKIREYAWNGYLLIALHEWYHILYNCGNNDTDHRNMLEDPVYHRWIRETFQCPQEIVKYFVYIGMEGSEMWNSLSYDEKLLVERIKKEYYIKK
jgi:hypothetical protein